jgi:hypothetical protein
MSEEGPSKKANLIDRFHLIPQRGPTAQSDDTPQLTFIGKPNKEAHDRSLAETANHDPPSVNSRIDFCRDELIDRGYRAQHSSFIFVGRRIKVETLDIKPTNSNPVGQGGSQ